MLREVTKICDRMPSPADFRPERPLAAPNLLVILPVDQLQVHHQARLQLHVMSEAELSQDVVRQLLYGPRRH